jgi:NADH:ubiquinone oxidoreductase subunit 5 (subunit L)/multisubunit Na+/H+ antiporter MnhA subunit
MEAPTPVSALMHAGVINAGGVLLLHFAPLLAQAPAALLLLTGIGTVTSGLGMLAMWAQTNVKRSLAWSTVSQMGFMLVQIGLAMFPAAALHLLGHGCYKAWAFLRAGELPSPAAPRPRLAPARALAVMLIGMVVAVPALWLAAAITGFDPLHAPGELALTGVVALSIGQLWPACFQVLRGGRAPLAALGLSLAWATLALALYRGAAIFFGPALGGAPSPVGPLAWAAAAIPLAGFGALAVLYQLLPAIGRTVAGRAFYIHALHGFYVGALVDRLVEQAWRGGRAFGRG